MLAIHLQQLKFHSFHGLYAEETIVGNDFEVNITIKFHPKEIPCTAIQQTIDYVAVYELVRERMLIPTPLLETIATDLVLAIFHQHPIAEEVMISIKKMNPPIQNFEGTVGVSLEFKRSDILLR